MITKIKTLITFWLVLLQIVSYSQTTYSTSKLSLTIGANNQIVSIANLQNSTNWGVTNAPIYNVTSSGNCSKDLSIVSTPDGSLQMVLKITNTSGDINTVAPVFPTMSGLNLVDGVADQLYYLFPEQGYAAENTNNVSRNSLYSGNFPMQFLNTYDATNGGFYLLCKDTSNYSKSFSLSKNNGSVSWSIKYRDKKLAPGESWTLPAVAIGSHLGDWHAAFYAYRNWTQEWYKPLTPRKQWFQNVFNFRQVFLHSIFGDTGAFDNTTKQINLVSKLAVDSAAFGGIDYVHIFDWSTTPQHGRVGDYSPWDYLGGKENLANEINKIQQSGKRVGLYLEGYLINRISQIGQNRGVEFQQLNQNGVPQTRFGSDYYYGCPLYSGWRNHLTDAARNAFDSLNTSGSYIDQFGFGWQYGCYNPAHQHDTSIAAGFPNALEIEGEDTLMKELSRKLGPQHVTYTEETPTDVASQHQDGSFSYALSSARTKNNPSRINLTRFALPDFKIFEILHVDAPMGNDIIGIKHVFFNGEGLWIEGPSTNTTWFPQNTLDVIKKTHAILIKYKEAFNSTNPQPLVQTLNNNVYANYFPSQNVNVWTLFNAANYTVSGSIVSIPHVNGAKYYDAWNGRYISPSIVGGQAIVNLSITDQDVGCIVQIVNSNVDPFRILNRELNGYYMYDGGNGQVKYGNMPDTSNLYKWSIEPYDGYTRLKNLQTANYMHVEQQSGSVQVGPAPSTSWSNQWSITDANVGWNYIQNRWKPNEMAHINNEVGYVEYANAVNTWWSAMWRFVPVDTAATIAPRPIEQDVSDKIQLYPNPVKDWLKINGASGYTTLLIESMTGNIIYRRSLTDNNNISANVNGITAGTYIVVLLSKDNSRKSFKIIKQ